MQHKNFHKDFKLDGNSFFSVEEILLYAKNNQPKVYAFLSNWYDKSDFITVSTSGSTGKPKNIKLKKEFMINSAKATGAFFDLFNETTALLCLPIHYIAGKMMLVRAMVLGWQLDVVQPDSSPLNGIDKKYDFSAMVPLQLFNSLNEINKITKLIVGGGAVSNELQSKILYLPTKIFATYGMTETITHIAIKPLNIAAGLNLQKDYYQTLDNVLLSVDHRNCLVINAPKILTDEIVTNDLVEIISKKQFKWLGRYDHVINSGGIKLIPEQIEKKLSEIISQRFFVAGVPDSVLGEKLVLIVEGQYSEIEIQDLKIEISNLRSLEKFEIPKKIVSLKCFKETETKKIKRQKTLDLIYR